MYQTATIGDYLWIDTDEDGIQDGGEVGYNNATINLYKSDHSFIGTTQTNAIGYYQFDDIVPGDYYVEFVLPLGYDFSPQDQGGDNSLDSDANISTGKTVTTTLSPAENDPTWDAGIHESAPTLASIGDYVWKDLDEDGVQDIAESGITKCNCKSVYERGNAVWNHNNKR